MDEKGEYLLWNRAAQEIVGLPLQEIAAVKSTEPCFYLPDKVTPYAPEQLALSRAMRGEVVDDIEVFVRHSKKPEGVFVSFNARPLKDALGFVCGGVSVFRDITARKRAEEELRRQTERFELAVAGSQDGLWDWDLTTDAVYYSPRYKAMLGYEDHEFPNRSEEWAKRVHPEDLERVRSETLAHFKSREPLSWVEFRMRHKDGSYRWIRSRAFVLRDSAGRVYRIAGSYEDITDRKTAEEELAQERYLLHTLMHNLPDGIYFKDTAGRFLRVNKAVMDTLHLDDPAQIVGKTDFDFFTKEYAQSTMTDEQEIIRTGRPLVGQEKLVGWLDGRQRWVSTTKMPFRDQGGNIIGTFGVTRDITERKQAEEILRRHEKRAP
jgi:PAS domain S-box-containing protein